MHILFFTCSCTPQYHQLAEVSTELTGILPYANKPAHGAAQALVQQLSLHSFSTHYRSSPAGSWDSMILTGPFQPEIHYDSTTGFDQGFCLVCVLGDFAVLGLFFSFYFTDAPVKTATFKNHQERKSCIH